LIGNVPHLILSDRPHRHSLINAPYLHIDGHNDLAILIRALYNNHIYNETFAKPFAEGGMPYHVDLPRLKAGMNGGAFWSVFWPCPENGTDYSDENYRSSKSHPFPFPFLPPLRLNVPPTP
jgi:hypothetical protein